MIVTVWATFQFVLVNVRVPALTVPSAVLELPRDIVTSAVGWLVRTTVNAAVPPASGVVRPLVGETTIPAESLSWFVTATSLALSPL